MATPKQRAERIARGPEPRVPEEDVLPLPGVFDPANPNAIPHEIMTRVSGQDVVLLAYAMETGEIVNELAFNSASVSAAGRWIRDHLRCDLHYRIAKRGEQA